jgi:tRNA(Ser,Leu) C12 N-acetylase TAN1
MKTEGARYAGVQVLDTLVKGNYFVEVKDHDPRELVLRICADFCDSSAQSTRFMYRMIPIHTVCRAHVPTIKELAQYTDHMKHGTADSADLPRKRFMVNTKVRNNTGLEASTEELKKSIAGEVDLQLFSIDLQFPDVVVFVYALNSAALIGIGEDVTRLRSFNIHELATQGPMPAEEIEQKRSKRDASIAAKTKANGAGNAPEGPNEAAGAPPTDPSAAPVVEPSDHVTEPSATVPDSADRAVDPSAPCTHLPAPVREPSTAATETPAAAAGSPIQGTDPSSPVTVPSAQPTESTNPPSTSDKEHFPGPSETCLRFSGDQADASTGAVTPVDHSAH